ncbi:unnamed protein product [Mytilus coruscus]|uniref:AIG1-type G domain-containing protein n=1 Tax=Mytilus coruscus TaxID=42192 RepID=A0A6J8EBS8_MYTCO|nr:unnamed protein product [Mytilus coruscus]
MAKAYNENGLRIVFVGGIGLGKSTTANAILGNKKFQNDDRFFGEHTYTSCSRSENANRLGTRITIVNTPELLKTTDIKDTFRMIETKMSLFHKLTHTKEALPVLRITSTLQEKEAEYQLKVIDTKATVKTQTTVFLVFFINIMVLLHSAKANNLDTNQVVHWKLMTKPVYFGENIDLECIIKTKETSAPMSWIMIPNGETIASDKIPTDVEKYGTAVKYNATAITYTLTIKQLNSTDVNRVYRCDFGFHSYADKLLLNDKDFICKNILIIAKPKDKDVKYNFSLVEGTLIGKVQIKNGYPEPLCFGIFEGKKLSEGMRITITNTSIFFETTIELKYSIDICGGSVNVTCTYGNYDLHINDLVGDCLEKSKSKITVVMVTTFITGILFGITVGVGCVLIKKRRRQARRELNEFTAVASALRGNASIVCVIQCDDKPGHMAWTKAGTIIGLNNASLYLTKYDVFLKNQGNSMIYTLVIKHITIGDLNLVYKCESEFSSAEGILPLNEDTFVATPQREDITWNFTSRRGYIKAYVEVSFVYPKPRCIAVFKERDKTSYSKTNFTIESFLYTVKFDLVYKTNECGKMKISCVIGKEKLSILPISHDFNKDCDPDGNQLIDIFTNSSTTVLTEPIHQLSEEDKIRCKNLMHSLEIEKRYCVRTMIVGKQSAEKTCLLRRLLKEDISDVSSTDVSDIVVRRCKINIEDGKWIIGKGI